MKLQELCEQTVADVDGCLGCAVVDLETGLPLGLEVARGSILGQDAMELMSAASVEYFRGNLIWQLELAMAGGQSLSSFVQEIQATTAHTSIFMSVVPGRESNLLLLITDKAANLGLGRIAMRQALAQIASEGEPAQQAPAPRVVAASSAMVMPSALAASARDAAGAAAAPGRSHVAYRDDLVPERAVEVDEHAVDAVDNAGRQWRGGHRRRGG